MNSNYKHYQHLTVVFNKLHKPRRGIGKFLQFIVTWDTESICLSLSRLVLYIEREVRSVTRVKKNLKYSAYLSRCLNSLVVHLSNTASLILGTHIHTL